MPRSIQPKEIGVSAHLRLSYCIAMNSPRNLGAGLLQNLLGESWSIPEAKHVITAGMDPWESSWN